MPKAFFTERDIEDMANRGIMSLDVNDNVVLTDQAYEKAKSLGMQLVRNRMDTPPAAPVRPYLSQMPQAPRQSLPGPAQPETGSAPASQPGKSEIHQRIRSVVIARLGNQI